jgi:hypothetical protein
MRLSEARCTTGLRKRKETAPWRSLLTPSRQVRGQLAMARRTGNIVMKKPAPSLTLLCRPFYGMRVSITFPASCAALEKGVRRIHPARHVVLPAVFGNAVRWFIMRQPREILAESIERVPMRVNNGADLTDAIKLADRITPMTRTPALWNYQPVMLVQSQGWYGHTQHVSRFADGVSGFVRGCHF